MCLLVLAWKTDPSLPLLLSGNRDERHARPSAALDWWADRDWIGGRDLVAGGTWLAAARDGRFAVVTNFPRIGPPPAARSRGHLVPDYLDSGLAPIDFLNVVARDRQHYAGFTLVTGDTDTIAYFSNADALPRALPAGFHGLGNDGLDVPSPRLKVARARVEALLASHGPDSNALFSLWGAKPRDSTDVAPFIAGDTYGTRCTTILRRTPDVLSIEELSYQADGQAGAPRAFRWSPAR